MKVMKRKFNLLVFFFAAVIAFGQVKAQENTRRFNKSWPVKEVETLSITNKFGEVKVNDTGGDAVTVDVVVTVEGSENRAKNILDDITVSFDKSGGMVSAETHMDSGFKSGGRFTINYTVNVPSDKNLVIHNKFGNTIVNKLTGKGQFDIAYGDLTANQIAGSSTQLSVAYGKADIDALADATVSLAYSKMYLGTGTKIELDSKYSNVSVDKLNGVHLESKYDSFNFGELNDLEGESKFTNYKIGLLGKRLKLDSAYGTVKVEQIPAGFTSLEVTSSYAQVSLGIDESASYQVYATCDYCDITYPRDEFKGNRMSENTRQTIDGKVASGTPGTVKVTSRYGNIKLTK